VAYLHERKFLWTEKLNASAAFYQARSKPMSKKWPPEATWVQKCSKWMLDLRVIKLTISKSECSEGAADTKMVGKVKERDWRNAFITDLRIFEERCQKAPVLL
jgi:hypothetical protein